MGGRVKDATDSRYFEFAARAGFAVNGVLHISYAIICWQILAGPSSRIGPGGPISGLARTGLGAGLLWVGAGSCLALCLWQLAKAVFERRGADLRRQLRHRGVWAARALVYGALSFMLIRFVLPGQADGAVSKDITSDMMKSAAGSVALVGVGVGIFMVAVYSVYKGVKRKFLDDLRGSAQHDIGRTTRALGVAGYTARGVALGAVALLVIVATVRSNFETEPGLDTALRALSQQPLGPWIVAGVGAGLLCYGIYSLARTRFAKM